MKTSKKMGRALRKLDVRNGLRTSLLLKWHGYLVNNVLFAVFKFPSGTGELRRLDISVPSKIPSAVFLIGTST
jgi:hypothetical protein